MQREKAPSMDAWLSEAKSDVSASECGMYLFHNGVVRETAKLTVRNGIDAPKVKGMSFSYDINKVAAAKERAMSMPGIKYVRIWLNSGELDIGDDIMLVLIGGDIRPNVVNALQTLVGELKSKCVTEKEIFRTESNS